MWMPFCIVTKALDGQYRANDSILQPENGSEKYTKAVGRTFTQLRQQLAIIEKNILAVRQGEENVFPQQFPELDNLFRMAGGTESAAPAGEG